ATLSRDADSLSYFIIDILGAMHTVQSTQRGTATLSRDADSLSYFIIDILSAMHKVQSTQRGTATLSRGAASLSQIITRKETHGKLYLCSQCCTSTIPDNCLRFFF
ncbi:MAG: hypothetical protein WCI30_07320, partial [Clostridia bacterium]